MWITTSSPALPERAGQVDLHACSPAIACRSVPNPCGVIGVDCVNPRLLVAHRSYRGASHGTPTNERPGPPHRSRGAGIHGPRTETQRERRATSGECSTRTGLLQIDSVNVLERSHYLPVFARLGPYEKSALDRYAFGRRPNLFEYWGHVASMMPVALFPLMRHRMETPHPRMRAFAEKHRRYIDGVLEQVRERGAFSVAELEDAGDRGNSRWGGSKGKAALEWLFRTGQLTTKERGPGFARVYDLTERVIPEEHFTAAPPSSDDAKKQLLLLSARHHGIGTVSDLADYYRLKIPESRPLLQRLVEEGALECVEVEGWKGPVYLHPEAKRPRSVHARALLSPFDPVVWHRERAERLFDFFYRIEIYVPQPKRRYGYYVLPFLLGDTLVGRVDLKANRQEGQLLARASHVEPGQDPHRVATELAAELRRMADWLGMDDVVVRNKGNLSRALRAAVI